MQDAMKKLDAELERHSKRQASKKSASGLSFDELMDDIRETGNTRDDLKNKFYNIIGYKQSSQDDVDQHFKRGCLNERGFDEYCAFWNLCVENEDKMRHYCNKECGFC
uniref:ShKT domain-containing protein n=1 Tax=Clytia hemisphaerica TaxID=252671 RepID=A0A7M5V4H8_9CNID|eukprot:TCONS_00029388-protein